MQGDIFLHHSVVEYPLLLRTYHHSCVCAFKCESFTHHNEHQNFNTKHNSRNKLVIFVVCAMKRRDIIEIIIPFSSLANMRVYVWHTKKSYSTHMRREREKFIKITPNVNLTVSCSIFYNDIWK